MTGPRPDLVERVREVRFQPVALRTGYQMGAVDDLLDELADAVSTGRAVRPLVDAARFPTTRFREGYDTGEVDDFLARLVADADGV